LPDGRPSGAIRGDQPGDPSGDRVGEIAVLRERIADKDAVIADLQHRLDVADRRLDEAAEERRLVNRLQTDLADARAAAMISGSEAAALRHQLDLLRARRPWWRRWLR
jgi:hypothetical protein